VSSTANHSARNLPAAERTPESLARLAQDGSLLAFSQLVEEFEARLFNFILRRVGNWADAEELTQETFVRAWERIGRYDSRWKFSTWLFTIGLRLAVSDHRSRSRMRLAPTHAVESVSRRDDAESVSDRELGAPTWDLAGRLLTPSQHTALWLRYAEGLGIAEIARIMNRTQVSVRVTLFRAREALAREINSFRTEHESDAREASAAALRALLASGIVSNAVVEGVQ
jgi:RNA polymerase sigma-70 factor (ECF subfamily)